MQLRIFQQLLCGMSVKNDTSAIRKDTEAIRVSRLPLSGSQDKLTVSQNSLNAQGRDPQYGLFVLTQMMILQIKASYVKNCVSQKRPAGIAVPAQAVFQGQGRLCWTTLKIGPIIWETAECSG
jgi:hypothetical protein